MFRALATMTLIFLLAAGGGAPALAREVLPAEKGAATPDNDNIAVRRQDDGHLLVSDSRHQVELRLPGPYWECRSPQQLAGQAPQGGCAPTARGADPSLVLSVIHKDAPAAVGLQAHPQRFLARNKGDLESYVDALQQQLRQQAGTVRNLRSQWMEQTPERGAIINLTEFTQVREDGMNAHFFLARCFVRPEGEEVRMFQLLAVAPESELPWLRADLEEIISSFRFTGEPAAQFMAPDAPPEKLPSAKQPQAAQPGPCGQGMLGVLPAIFIVIGLYYFFVLRRRKSQPQM